MADLPVFVLDTFALIAYLRDEQAAERIEKALQDANRKKCRLLVSIINLGELLYLTERKGGVARAQDALALIRQLPVEILPADEQSVFAAAHVKANYPLSYADAYVVAVALFENAIVLTGAPEFESVESIVTVEWLGRTA